MPMIGSAGRIATKYSAGVGHQLVFEPVHRGKKEGDVKQAQPNHTPVVAFPGRSADHFNSFETEDQAPWRPRERTATRALTPCITTQAKGIQ